MRAAATALCFSLRWRIGGTAQELSKVVREQLERGGVNRANDAEVLPVHGAHLLRLPPFSDRDDASIRAAEWQVGVLPHEFSHACDVLWHETGDRSQLAGCERIQERRFDLCATASSQQVAHFGNDRGRDHKVSRVDVVIPTYTRCVTGIIGIRQGYEGPRVDHDHSPKPVSRRISSARVDVSEWPECPMPMKAGRTERGLCSMNGLRVCTTASISSSGTLSIRACSSSRVVMVSRVAKVPLISSRVSLPTVVGRGDHLGRRLTTCGYSRRRERSLITLIAATAWLFSRCSRIGRMRSSRFAAL
ncbi:hypothetical protein H180DRAFT_04461 [Streptomyces sp. WMMB 322]|nr:hypothetical protein H180DRAFT_04461 [Streptomyces sp. WMMB 322]